MPWMMEIDTPTLITEGSCIQGNLVFLAAAQIHGLVEGDLEHRSLEPLSIGKNGQVNGSIRANGPVLVDGRVEGEVVSAVKIRLSSTAQVRGNIRAPQVEVCAGAVFNGEFKMTASVQQSLQKRAA